jgi:hypothetical protein
MHIGLVIFATIVIILWAVIKNRLQDNNKKDDNVEIQGTIETNKENTEMIDMFYEEVKNGENIYKLMNVFNQFDLMFIKSLFQSEQIPYHMESEHLSKMRPGMQIGSFGNADIYILEKDYNDAIKIIEEYRKTK